MGNEQVRRLPNSTLSCERYFRAFAYEYHAGPSTTDAMAISEAYPSAQRVFLGPQPSVRP